MGNSGEEHSAVVEIIVASERGVGAKGFFDEKKVESVTGVFSLPSISKSIRSFSKEISEVFDDITPADLKLNQIELSVEITTSGELRLIAAAGIETKGAIKLTFSRPVK